MVSSGRVVSTTVTVNDADEELLRVSLAVQVTVVEPNGKVAPLAGTHETARRPSTASTADAEYVKVAPDGPVASTVAPGGTVITGPSVSAGWWTITWVVDHDDTFSDASKARALSVIGPSGTAVVSQLTM